MNQTQGAVCPSKLSSARRPGANRAVHVWLNRRADVDLLNAHNTYATFIGREVSQSLLIRRALELLADHTRSIKTPAQVNAESAALLRQVG